MPIDDLLAMQKEWPTDAPVNDLTSNLATLTEIGDKPAKDFALASDAVNVLNRAGDA